MASLFSPGPRGQADDFARLLASPAALLPSPLGAQAFFAGQATPGGHKGPFAVQEGRLSFDVLLQEHDAGAGELPGLAAEAARATLLNARSASHLELFALGGPAAATRPAPVAEPARPPPAEVQAALTEAIVAKVVAAKEEEVAALVAGVTAKYGLAADYGKAEETIKAVWAEQRPQPSRASSAADGSKQQMGTQHTAGTEPTLADNAKASSDHMSCDEEAGQQATSTLKPPHATQAAATEGMTGLKRPLSGPAAFSFDVPPPPSDAGMAPPPPPAEDAALKRRRVQYDRMRELESDVQRVSHLGDALKQSLRQAEAQHEAAVLENEQLWNALLHIHASLRAAHAAIIRQQVAMHTAAVAAALPPPPPQAAMVEPSPALFGNLFSPDAEELAAACGMFISPAKPMAAAAANNGANNKPRKLFLEEEAGRGAAGAMGMGSAGRPSSLLGNVTVAELSPALWVQAA